ncbi:hypothetical protein AALA22_13170 [Anaerovoracaceae bacterium 41-7]
MSKVTVCDVCGKMRTKFFLIEVYPPIVSLLDDSKLRSETGKKDVCMDCYADIKEFVMKLQGEK